MVSSFELFCDDCLNVSSLSTVDMILVDPPYGSTTCKWDSVIPFDDMWEFIPELRHTFGYHEYIVNENPEDFVHMEAVTDLYKKTEIKMVTIDNYSKHCSCILEEREDENVVLVYWFCGTYYAFDLNPTNISKYFDDTKRYFYELM